MPISNDFLFNPFKFFERQAQRREEKRKKQQEEEAKENRWINMHPMLERMPELQKPPEIIEDDISQFRQELERHIVTSMGIRHFMQEETKKSSNIHPHFLVNYPIEPPRQIISMEESLAKEYSARYQIQLSEISEKDVHKNFNISKRQGPCIIGRTYFSREDRIGFNFLFGNRPKEKQIRFRIPMGAYLLYSHNDKHLFAWKTRQESYLVADIDPSLRQTAVNLNNLNREYKMLNYKQLCEKHGFSSGSLDVPITGEHSPFATQLIGLMLSESYKEIFSDVAMAMMENDYEVRRSEDENDARVTIAEYHNVKDIGFDKAKSLLASKKTQEKETPFTKLIPNTKQEKRRILMTVGRYLEKYFPSSQYKWKDHQAKKLCDDAQILLDTNFDTECRFVSDNISSFYQEAFGGRSCMTGMSYTRAKLYDQSQNCYLMIVYPKDRKLIITSENAARALIWVTQDGVYHDRIFSTTNDMYNQLVAHARLLGIKDLRAQNEKIRVPIGKKSHLAEFFISTGAPPPIYEKKQKTPYLDTMLGFIKKGQGVYITNNSKIATHNKDGQKLKNSSLGCIICQKMPTDDEHFRALNDYTPILFNSERLDVVRNNPYSPVCAECAISLSKAKLVLAYDLTGYKGQNPYEMNVVVIMEHPKYPSAIDVCGRCNHVFTKRSLLDNFCGTKLCIQCNRQYKTRKKCHICGTRKFDRSECHTLLETDNKRISPKELPPVVTRYLRLDLNPSQSFSTEYQQYYVEHNKCMSGWSIPIGKLIKSYEPMKGMPTLSQIFKHLKGQVGFDKAVEDIEIPWNVKSAIKDGFYVEGTRVTLLNKRLRELLETDKNLNGKKIKDILLNEVAKTEKAIKEIEVNEEALRILQNAGMISPELFNIKKRKDHADDNLQPAPVSTTCPRTDTSRERKRYIITF